MENYEAIIKLINHNRLICFFRGKKYLVRKIYHEKTGKDLDFNSASTFREKLQLLKLTNNPLIIQCADKNAVRSYVAAKIGSEYLVPQYFCKKHIAAKDLVNLPSSFIIKTTSGSGANIVVKNKASVNLAKICQKMNRYAKIKYGYLWGEFFYNHAHNRIVAEKLLTKDEVYDYKIHCFRSNSGELRQIIEVLWGPKDNRHKNMYNPEWQPLSYHFSLPPDDKTFKKPKQLSRLLELSAKLSEDFNYVRIDFYIIADRIYFGELTFVPTAGFGSFEPDHYDQIWGSWIGNNLEKEE